jgi:transposase
LLSANPDYKHIQQLLGVGPVVAAGTIAAIGDGKQFKNGRQFAVWIGITPKQFARGENLFVDIGHHRPLGCKGHWSS